MREGGAYSPSPSQCLFCREKWVRTQKNTELEAEPFVEALSSPRRLRQSSVKTDAGSPRYPSFPFPSSYDPRCYLRLLPLAHSFNFAIEYPLVVFDCFHFLLSVAQRALFRVGGRSNARRHAQYRTSRLKPTMHLQSIFRVDTSSTDCLLLIALVFSNVFIPAASAAPLSSQAQHELTDLLEPHHRSLQARQSDAEERYILANCDLGSGNKYSQIAQFSSGTSSTPLQISEITPSSGVEGPIKWEGTQHTAYFPDKTKFYVNIITPETVKVEKWFGTAIKNDVRSRDREFTCWSGRWHYQWEGRQCTGLYECNRTPRPVSIVLFECKEVANVFNL